MREVSAKLGLALARWYASRSSRSLPPLNSLVGRCNHDGILEREWLCIAHYSPRAILPFASKPRSLTYPIKSVAVNSPPGFDHLDARPWHSVLFLIIYLN